MDRHAMIASAVAALRARWANVGAPAAEHVAAIRAALAGYEGEVGSWQQLLDEALATIGVFVDWRPGAKVYGFSLNGSVRPWGDEDVDAVWPAAEAA